MVAHDGANVPAGDGGRRDGCRFVDPGPIGAGAWPTLPPAAGWLFLLSALLVAAYLRIEGLGDPPLLAAEARAAGRLDALADDAGRRAVSELGMRGTAAPRLLGALLGAVAVALVGFLLRRAAPLERLVAPLGALLLGLHAGHISLSRLGEGSGPDAAIGVLAFSALAFAATLRGAGAARALALVALVPVTWLLWTGGGPPTGASILDVARVIGAPLALAALVGAAGAFTRDPKWCFALLVWAAAPLIAWLAGGARPTTMLLVALPGWALLGAEGFACILTLARHTFWRFAALAAIACVLAAPFVLDPSDPQWAARILEVAGAAR